jgi:hypothetical protein
LLKYQYFLGCREQKPPVSNKKVELSFSGERISSDGGLLLLREVENQLGLLRRISSCITGTRDSIYIDHTLKEMITQRVFQIAAGYEDCNDCNDRRVIFFKKFTEIPVYELIRL